MDLLDTTAAVMTPERVRFRYRLAGPGRRAIAWTIDAILRLLFVLFVAVIVTLLSIIPGLSGVGAARKKVGDCLRMAWVGGSIGRFGCLHSGMLAWCRGGGL